MAETLKIARSWITDNSLLRVSNKMCLFIQLSFSIITHEISFDFIEEKVVKHDFDNSLLIFQRLSIDPLIKMKQLHWVSNKVIAF